MVITGITESIPLPIPLSILWARTWKGGLRDKGQLVLRHNQQKGPPCHEPPSSDSTRATGTPRPEAAPASISDASAKCSDAQSVSQVSLHARSSQLAATGLPAKTVAEICDLHLRWIRRRTIAGIPQRYCKSILNHWCNHVVGLFGGKRLPGHGQQIGRLVPAMSSPEPTPISICSTAAVNAQPTYRPAAGRQRPAGDRDRT